MKAAPSAAPHPLRPLAGLAVLAASVLLLGLLALQQLPLAPPCLAELSRFLPYYWLLPPLLAACGASLWLGWRWRLLALANVLLLGLVVMDFHWQLQAPDSVAGVHVRVLSYNIKALQARQREGGIEAIEREVALYAPDIVALQDAQHWLAEHDARSPQPARPVFGLPHVVAYRQFVLASRYPLQDCQGGNASPADPDADADADADSEATAVAAPFLRCAMHLGGQEVQLITLHFASPRGALLATRRDWRSGLQAWQNNLGLRLHQAHSLARSLARSPAESGQMPALVVMGDFNAAAGSPVLEPFWSLGLQDSFALGGRGWGYSHGHALNRKIDLYRIDHILVGPHWLVQQAQTGSSDASEHNPVLADLLLQGASAEPAAALKP